MTNITIITIQATVGFLAKGHLVLFSYMFSISFFCSRLETRDKESENFRKKVYRNNI